jgi:hypothetical protein
VEKPSSAAAGAAALICVACAVHFAVLRHDRSSSAHYKGRESRTSHVGGGRGPLQNTQQEKAILCNVAGKPS